MDDTRFALFLTESSRALVLFLPSDNVETLTGYNAGYYHGPLRSTRVGSSILTRPWCDILASPTLRSQGPREQVDDVYVRGTGDFVKNLCFRPLVDIHGVSDTVCFNLHCLTVLSPGFGSGHFTVSLFFRSVSTFTPKRSQSVNTVSSFSQVTSDRCPEASPLVPPSTGPCPQRYPSRSVTLSRLDVGRASMDLLGPLARVSS